MTPKEAFDQLEARRSAIPLDEVHPPRHGSVQDLIDELERLTQITDRDRARFVRLAQAQLFDMENIDLLSPSSLSVQFAENEWITHNNPTQNPVITEKLKLAEEVRAMLLLDLCFVAKKFNPKGLVGAISEIQECTPRATLIDDLSIEAELARRFSEQLARIGHDAKIADEAFRLCDELKQVVQTDQERMVRVRENRDRAATLAEQLYDEVRAAGQFLFRKNPKRLAQYADRLNPLSQFNLQR